MLQLHVIVMMRLTIQQCNSCKKQGPLSTVQLYKLQATRAATRCLQLYSGISARRDAHLYRVCSVQIVHVQLYVSFIHVLKLYLVQLQLHVLGNMRS